VAGIALIDIGEGDGFAGGVLDGRSETPDLGSIVDISWSFVKNPCFRLRRRPVPLLAF
jgi:hypothetical protein